LDQKVQTTAVGQLEGPLPALGVFDLVPSTPLGGIACLSNKRKIPKKNTPIQIDVVKSGGIQRDEADRDLMP
jgi:hypothetical protein